MKETFGPDHPLAVEAQKSIEDERVFSSFLCPLIEELNQLYGSAMTYEEKLREREKVFALALERFKSLSDKFQTPRFARFGQGPLNNAVLVSLAVYHGHYPLFERALQQSGDSIPALLRVLRTMSREEKDMVFAIREWLEKNEAHHPPG
jgi:predicted aminopeptidase